MHHEPPLCQQVCQKCALARPWTIPGSSWGCKSQQKGRPKLVTKPRPQTELDHLAIEVAARPSTQQHQAAPKAFCNSSSSSSPSSSVIHAYLPLTTKYKCKNDYQNQGSGGHLSVRVCIGLSAVTTRPAGLAQELSGDLAVRTPSPIKR